MEPAATILDLDSLLDKQMDDVETLPDFVNPPAGTYMLGVTKCGPEKYKPKATSDNPNPVEAGRIRITYAVEKTLQLGDPKELPVKEGSLFSESFMLTEEGLKFFKRQAMNILNVEDLKGATLKDVMTGLADAKFKAGITVVKTAGKEAGVSYENVRVRPVHDVAA